jgi:AcrR family transcriptional regulator
MSEKIKPHSPWHVSPQPASKIAKSDRTRAAILNSALDFVWSHPFRDMTVTSVMAPTGVSRSAFYHYFSDLHEVMETLLTMFQEEIFRAVEPWLARAGDPIALMQETLAGLVEVCHQRGPFLTSRPDPSPMRSTVSMPTPSCRRSGTARESGRRRYGRR